MSDLSEMERLEKEQQRTLKLSEAIRIGGVGRRQTSTYFDGRDGCCAWGAAAIAMGYDHSGPVQHFLRRHFPVSESVWLEVHGKNAIRRAFPENTFNGIADWLQAQGL